MEKNGTVNLKAFAIATLIPVAMMVAAMWMKPLWRDEYFTQYFSDPDQSLSWLLPNRWASDPHPPAYNPLLWIWSQISVHPFWQKSLSLLILALGGLGALKIIRPDQKRHLYIFLLTCLGSYWVIYFATEIRPYVFNFTLSALMTILAVRVSEQDRAGWSYLLLFMIFGIILSLTHYFGALWFACLGLVLGLTKLSVGQKSNFVKIGIVSALGMIPILLWLNYSYHQIELSAIPNAAGPLERLGAGGHQFLRGLTIKTFLSNPLITFLGIGAIWAAIKGRHKSDAVLVRAAALTVVIAFLLHLFFRDMIKERAFIVIMPALLWIMAGRVAQTNHKWGKYLPWLTAIMPFLFITEYFKTKEKIPELQKAMAPYQAVCADTPLAVYYRPAPPEALFRWTSEKVFEGFGAGIVDLKTTNHLANTPCPVLAVSVLLPKKDQPLIDEAEDYIIAAGYKGDFERLEFGKGRSLLWLKKPKSTKD